VPPAFGLYTHIRRNRIISRLLLAGLFFLVLVVAFAGVLAASALSMGGESFGRILGAAVSSFPYVAPFAVMGTALWVLFALSAHQWIIDKVTGARPISRGEAPKLHALTEALCISRGMTMPTLKILDSDALNAFASGLEPDKMTVTVTSGLLAALDDRELESVIAHELTHIRNDDVRLMVIAVLVAGVASFFGEIIYRILASPRTGRTGWRIGGGSRSGDSNRKGGGGAVLAILLAVVLIMIAWALSQVIRFALSRAREFLADAGAVELTKNPDAMISALLKIRGRGELPGVPSGVMEMCVDNPKNGFVDLFASHPSIEDRVDALRLYAGGRITAPNPG
jgi:heat shock protein HtpX